MSHKQRQAIEWRRNKIQELLIKGLNQTQIADTLKVSEYTISKDVDFLRIQARENMKEHLENVLPREYENCMAGINQVLKMSWEIATGTKEIDNNPNSNNTTSTIIDDRTKLQALALANDCYKYKMDLVTNGVVIKDAIKFVQQKKEELSKVT